MPIVVEADVRERFEQMKSAWKEQSHYLSNTAQMYEACPDELLEPGFEKVAIYGYGFFYTHAARQLPDDFQRWERPPEEKWRCLLLALLIE